MKKTQNPRSDQKILDLVRNPRSGNAASIKSISSANRRLFSVIAFISFSFSQQVSFNAMLNSRNYTNVAKLYYSTI